jgi:hypothetical protein
MLSVHAFGDTFSEQLWDAVIFFFDYKLSHAEST